MEPGPSEDAVGQEVPALFSKPKAEEQPQMLFSKEEPSEATQSMYDELDDSMYADGGENFDVFNKLLDSLKDGPSAPGETSTVLKIPP